MTLRNTFCPCLCALACLLASHSFSFGQPSQSSKTKADIEVGAVDLAGRPLPYLVPGEYARVRARIDLARLPSAASLAIGARATFKTTILGRPVSYTVSLPAAGTASSLLNPAVGVEGSAQPLGKDLPAGVYEETFDFQVPPETPAGSVTITVRLSGSSLAPVQRTFRLQVIRP